MYYSYKLNHNYGKVSVGPDSYRETVGIINEQGRLEHLVFDGEVHVDNAVAIDQEGIGFVTTFFGSPGYRQSDKQSWSFVAAPDYLPCLVIRGNCYALIEKQKPFICQPTNKHYSLVGQYVKSPSETLFDTSNVTSLAEYKRKINEV